MQWVVMQLTSWADKHVTTAVLAKELRQRLKMEDLELFYPSVEDVVGKHASSFSEYVFVEYRENLDYSELEGGDLFKAVLRFPGKNQPIHLLSDEEVDKVRGSSEREKHLQPGDRVCILRGPLKGTIGLVQNANEGFVTLMVLMGEVDQDAVVPRHWIRPLKKKTNPKPSNLDSDTPHKDLL